MTSLSDLIQKVNIARKKFIAVASGLTAQQTSFKPSEDRWSITDNVEHLVWAEMGGINGMWKVLNATKAGQSVYAGELTHRGKSIEEIVALTWKEKETVPEIAKPRWGGPVEYWIEALNNNQHLLERLGKEMANENPEKIIHPHPISGPLNVIQRLEFLRFHLERHQKQMERIKSEKNYPN